MRIEHRGKRPLVDPSAWVAPTAILSGSVTIGPHSRVLHGAVLTAEGGSIVLGEHCIVMETAVVRGTKRHPVTIGNHVLIGPRAYLSGCSVEDCAFIATGAAIFNGAVIGARAEVRVNGTVHVNSHLAADATVPIGWIAVGRPARLFPPSAHEELWPIQAALDFPGTVFGLGRPQAGGTIMPELTRRYAKALLAHREDKTIEDE
ncbi:MAG TPA: gamma carbonic anhydrase family protein [Alphaproteobacteria bacterium]|nr:gamma carbonic anhydrase family protein [Alphaproteobacteria bacterium]